MKHIDKIAKFLVLIVFIFCQSLTAQEEQIAFVPGVFEIDQANRAKYDILNKYKDDFQVARLFRNEKGMYRVEIVSSKRGRTWSERFELKPEELELIREKLISSTAAVPAKNNLLGRAAFVTSATLSSIPQGIFISYLTSRKVTEDWGWGGYTYEERTKFGQFSPFLISAGVFAGSLISSHNKYISPAASNTLFWNSGVGIMHGVALELMFAGDDAFESNRHLATLGIASATEGWLFYALAKNKNISYAHSMAWNTGNIWGTTAGFFGGFLIPDRNFRDDPSIRAIGGGMLAFGAGGVLLTDYLHKKMPRSTGDYRAMNSFMLSASIIGLASVVETDNARILGAGGLATSAIGLTLAYLATNDTDFTPAEGSLISVGTGVGFLFGSGLTILTQPETANGAFITVGLSSMLGWLGTYLYFRTDNKLPSKTQGKGSFNFGLNPSGMMLAMQTPEQQYRQLLQPIRSDIANIRWTF